MNRERRIEQLEFELAERGTDILELRNQLAEARAEIERLRQELRDNSTLAARQIVPAEMALDDATAELVRKDRLIEQMREALERTMILLDSVPTYAQDFAKDEKLKQIGKMVNTDGLYALVRDALAAERGKG